MKFGKLASLVIFLSFAGAGIMLVFSVAFDVLGLPSRYMGALGGSVLGNLATRYKAFGRLHWGQ